MRSVPLGLLLATAAANAVPVSLPPFTRDVLSNGVTVRVMYKADAPLVSVRVVVPGGSESDPPLLAGLSSVVSSLVLRGTMTRSDDEFAADVDVLGASIQSSVNPQRTMFALESLPATLPAALDLLSDAISHPAFRDSEIERHIGLAIERSRTAKDTPGDVIWQYFRAFYFPEEHPYSRPLSGDEATLPRITRKAIVDYHARMYTGRNLIVTAVGPIKISEMKALLTGAFENINSGRRYVWPTRQAASKQTSPRLLLIDAPDATQAQFVIGFLGISRTSPDAAGLSLVNNILGGRFTSLLNERLRVSSGLTYGAYSSLQQDRLPGAISLYSSASTVNTKRAIEMALAVVRQLVEDGVSAEQLASARTYIESSYPPDNIQTASQLSYVLADLELYRRPRAEIDGLFTRLDSVTVAQANRVLRQYFSSTAPVVVVLGSSGHIREQLEAFASTTIEVSLGSPGFACGHSNASATNSKQ
jgi:zinc protease